jgi:hypothetical protein
MRLFGVVYRNETELNVTENVGVKSTKVQTLGELRVHDTI